MKISFVVLLGVLLTACTLQNSPKVAELKYRAQARGFLVTLNATSHQIIYNNNHQVDTLTISDEQWNSLSELALKLDIDSLKNEPFPTHLLADDRAILAELTLAIDTAFHKLKFIHSRPPEGLKPLISELFSDVSK